MRDPRLVEIEFLMDLDRQGQVTVRSTMLDDSTGCLRSDGRLHAYGVQAAQFRDLLVNLLQRRLVVGFTARSTNTLYPDMLDAEQFTLLQQLIAGQDVRVHISHAGRLRLWDLRDALLRDPDVEPMGLLSQAAWERALPLRLQWASAEEPLTIIFADLDDFGRVNKKLGHGVGNKVLQVAFALIKNLVGSRGTVYRCGGEEIGVLAPKTSLESGRALAEELRVVIADGVHAQVAELGGKAQTASIGVAAFTERVAPDAAIQCVDARMRRAKAGGKNRVVAAD